MKTVVFAYNNIGCVGLEALAQAGFEIAAVFTHADDPNENCFFRSVAETAAPLGIPVYAPENPNHPLVVAQIRELAPDCIFSFYYRKLLSTEVLGLAPKGAYNLHGSLLPRYRGKCPVNWVLVNGERETGVTLHRMTPKPDDGDIVAQRKVLISDDDTAATLHAKCAAAAGELLKEALPAIAGGLATFTPQDESKATYFHARRPSDGLIDWTRSAEGVRNLVRAVTRPYPGAFTFAAGRKLFVWRATALPSDGSNAQPGSVISADPLVVACGSGSLRLDLAQLEGDVSVTGAQLASDACLAPGARLLRTNLPIGKNKAKVLILGVNGFIGSSLSERLLSEDGYEVYGMDLRSNYVTELLANPDFHFCEGDVEINREWIEYHIKKCDLVVPLVAIATPIEYVRNPLRVFELDFESNLSVIRLCHKYGKRIVFPSTSEVYAMCDDEFFDEDNSRLIVGPIRNQRWIYSCIKQMLDRVIWAYGGEGLEFTLFRPFNWIGPKLDSLDSARIGSSRAITQLILNLVEGTPIQLVDGGEQKRCFTDVADGVECLFRIVRNAGGRCDGKIINIGNPDCETSIRELAERLVAQFEAHPLRSKFPPFAGFRKVDSSTYYGPGGYQDCVHRKPSIRNALRYCDWKPTVPFETSIAKTLDFFLRDAALSKSTNGDKPQE